MTPETLPRPGPESTAGAAAPHATAPRYLAVQLGARRRYAVPAALAREGMLETLYTDACGNLGLGRLAACLPKALRGAALESLASRQIPAELLDKTVSFAWREMRGAALGSLTRDRDRRGRLRDAAAHGAGPAMIRRGVGRATHVYSMLGQVITFVEYARSRGLTVVSDFFIMPSGQAITIREARDYPMLAEPPPPDLAEARMGYVQRVADATDYAICPSERVADDLSETLGFPREKSFVVPFGVPESALAIENEPEPGRVLFAGTADVRKGIHYLAQAANVMKIAPSPLAFRVAGNVTERVRAYCHEIAPQMRFLGRLPYSAMLEEFRRADLFVLPTLCEGSAGAVYEALGAGLPVVTTAAAGSIVRDEFEGRIVPERDPHALAEAIAEIAADRDLRTRLASNAKNRAREFSWNRYAEHLASVLRGL
ncbi:MAG: glycosyltransferase [Sumerlaeia bacterium]